MKKKETVNVVRHAKLLLLGNEAGDLISIKIRLYGQSLQDVNIGLILGYNNNNNNNNKHDLYRAFFVT